MAAKLFLATARDGYCVKTTSSGDCNLGNHGTLVADGWDWPSFAAACLTACAACARCHFVSISYTWRDCSWAFACDLQDLHQDVAGFRTGRALAMPLPATAAPPPSPPPLPLPHAAPLMAASEAFGRDTILSFAQLERGLVLGDATRLRRKLRAGMGVTLAAIGASNTVRGGCQASQGGKCASKKYIARDAHGNAHGWLLQAFEAMNRSWHAPPHAPHRLVNRGMMATGPEVRSSSQQTRHCFPCCRARAFPFIDSAHAYFHLAGVCDVR